MAKQAVMYHDKGRFVPYKNSGEEPISVGDVVVLTGRIGIATEDIAVGATENLDTEGVWKLAAETGVAWNQGDSLYWDATNQRLTKTSTNNTAAGWAWVSKSANDAVGYVKIG